MLTYGVADDADLRLSNYHVENGVTVFDVDVSERGKQLSLGMRAVSFLGAFALGGFGVASDLMWDASLNLGYQWTKGFATTIGYRYLDVDYEKNGFLYDVAQDGLILGLSWRF